MATKKVSTRLTDSIRDPKKPIEHTVIFEWNPNQERCPFSEFKLSGPHKGKKRLEQIGSGLWRADYVSAETVQRAIEYGIDVLSVRTERAAIISNTSFKLCPEVMNEIRQSPNWQRIGRDFKSVGVYVDKEGKTIKEAEFIVYPNLNKKRCIAEVRVCVLDDGFISDMFEASNDIRENFLFWTRYGSKSYDGDVIDRNIKNGFTNNLNLKFVPVQ
jgi:hypothetical protein